MHDSNQTDEGRAILSYRTADMIVALLLLGGSAVVIFDCVRLGFGWQEDGPAPGFFPFYVAVLMAVASIFNLASGLRAKDGDEPFVTSTPFLRVLAVLIPSIVYVALIAWIGIYAASAIFIFGFMVAIGREGILKAIAVALFVPAALFMMFEKWFLVPLPKGPVEAFLGL